jgi:hypothetical protein
LHQNTYRGVSDADEIENDSSDGVMSSYFKAIAIDFDGTMTEGGRPHEGLLASLSEARDAGMRLVLVTGRVVTDLLRVFPDVEQWFDVIVAENGAVIRRDGVSRALTAPVPLELDGPLVAQGVHFQRGQVLLACSGEDELIVLREIRRLEADCQLIRNRTALMVLPSEISKGSGLLEVLEGLGVSYHSAIGIGDAENDLALLRHCELGVAVGNAVESLKREADIVLTASAGKGVADFLRDRVLGEEQLPSSRRWRVTLGRSDNGGGVRLPASQVNLLFVGGSGVGKSYAAGLLAERLIELDYSVCFIDPQGDHAPLGRLPKVLTVGGRGLLPRAEDVPQLLRQQLGSLIVDLSFVSEAQQRPYVAELLEALHEERRRSGLPHWILVDEAHVPFAEGGTACRVFRGQKGLCLVTYDPGELCRSPGLEFDFLIAIPGEDGMEPATVEGMRTLFDTNGPERVRLPQEGQALLARLGDSPRAELFKLGPRFVQHVRHWHKYADSVLPPSSVFRFRSFFGPTGARADNLAAFRRELLLCEPSVLQHHAAHHDFSHWLEHAIRDEKLARVAHDLEERSGPHASCEDLRRGLIDAIEDRYLA